MGPSSSHTIGPQNACKEFLAEYPFIDGYKVVLYGSLAKTGKGHMTDSVIRKSFENICGEVEFNCEKKDLHHPNTMEIYGFDGGREVACWHVTSVGGGAIKIKGRKKSEPREVYPHKNFAEISDYCKAENIRLCEYAEKFFQVFFRVVPR